MQETLRDVGLIPGSRSPGEGNGNPFQDFCLGDPRDRGVWWAYSIWGHKRVRHDWATEHASPWFTWGSSNHQDHWIKPSLELGSLQKQLVWAPNQYDWCPYEEVKYRHTDSQGRVLCEDEGRDRGDPLKPRNAKDVPADHQQLGEKSGTEESPSPNQKEPTNLTPWFWTLGLWDYESKFLLLKSSSLPHLFLPGLGCWWASLVALW